MYMLFTVQESEDTLPFSITETILRFKIQKRNNNTTEVVKNLSSKALININDIMSFDLNSHIFH